MQIDRVYSADEETKRMTMNTYMNVKNEAEKVIRRSKKGANNAFGKKMNDDPIKNKELFWKQVRKARNQEKNSYANIKDSIESTSK